ncbi:MAG: efflux RND transporter periplasmic adaptor subunit [Parvularculaceae bacterium]|nr:efflux RND transporter periplasmic adaptor subunit [Parvularculaceae bacterium]
MIALKKLLRKPPLLAAAGVVALAAGGAFIAGLFQPAATAAEAAAPQGPPPAPVKIAEAVMTELAPHAGAPGSVVSTSDSQIAAATPGPIVWVAEVGAEVEKGGVIARIDPADATATRDEARADIGRLGARAEQLSKLVERYEGLGEEGGESEATIDELRANRDAARHDLARARVALRRAETALERTEVRAPFSGRVVAREIDVGEFVSPGAALVRLVNTEDLEVAARAADALLASVSPGDTIAVTNGDQSVDATVRAVVPVGDETTRTLEIRLDLPETGWRVGTAVEVRLPRTAKRRVVAVNRDALILRAERVSVFVIGADDIAKQVDIELGAADGDLIEAIGDIKAGDRIVIRGGERLRDGQKVLVQTGGPAGALS